MVDEVPEQQHPEHDQDQQHPDRRLYARSRRIHDDIPCVLVVTQGADATWSITGHGDDLPAHGVRVPDDVMVLLAQQIVQRSR